MFLVVSISPSSFISLMPLNLSFGCQLTTKNKLRSLPSLTWFWLFLSVPEFNKRSEQASKKLHKVVLSHYLLLKSAPKSPSGSARGEKASLAGSLTWFWLLTAVMGRRSTPPSRPASSQQQPAAASSSQQPAASSRWVGGALLPPTTAVNKQNQVKHSEQASKNYTKWY